MSGVEATIDLKINAKLSRADDLGISQFKLSEIAELLSFVPGTAAVDQANLFFSDTRTLSASASETLDLAGSLTDALGATFTAAEILLVFVRAAAANTNAVVIGNAASNGFAGPLSATGTYTVQPDEYYLAATKAGWAVTAGTGDLLKIANGGGSTPVTYDIVIIGRTTAA